ncbi:FAD/NAD(P)-binding domain-containing protein [Hortaea werneckii]|nr:FAD/NAD(P)-binding domain-containing protein [Hortaea werneckii]
MFSKPCLTRQMNFFRRSHPPESPNSAKKHSGGNMSPAARETSGEKTRPKVAIVGSGCAGLGAAWALKDSDYEVHIFEKSSKLGGHTNTQPFRHGDDQVPVDTGFIVMNTATYPNFIRFLKEVGVDPVETQMTFGVSRDRGKFEWSGEGHGIFAQRRNLFRLRHWRMIFDIVRFNQFALDLLADEDDDGIDRLGSPPKYRKFAADMSIGEYLDREGYSQAFRDDYLIPMTAAVWSTSPDKASLEFPAATLIRFMWNHHLLSTLAARPPWLTIPGGSHRYIDAIVSQYPKDKLHIHTSCEVANILRPTAGSDSGVTVSWINAKTNRIEGDVFEHAVLACHGDEVLPLLAKHGTQQKQLQEATSKEQERLTKSASGVPYVSQEELDIFNAFETTENVCYLHSDLSLMPKRRAVWTAWNYLVSSTPSKLSHPAGVSLTYCMNILQHLPEKTYGPVLVTMNPDHPPEPKLTQGKFLYRHPLYTSASVAAQKRLDSIQGERGVSYCGAWTKYGFHEDGFSSGLRVAIEQLDAKLPFPFVDSTFSRGHRPVLEWRDYVLRLFLLVAMFWIRTVEWGIGLPGVALLVRLVEAVVHTVLDLAEFVGLL